MLLFMLLLSIINVIFCIAFTGFAYLNLNDKDSWIWVTIYIVAAVLCGLAAFEQFYPAVYIPVISFYLVYAIVLFFAKDGVRDWATKYRMQHIAQSMQATKPYIEKTREFFGLLIISVALLVNLLAS